MKRGFLFLTFLLGIALPPLSIVHADSVCSYGSTQARVQNNITVPWSQNISVGCERVFNVGSFHNGTGQFTGDTSLYVSGPGVGGYFANGNTVTIPGSIWNGTYILSVNTSNQSGPACTEQANVYFTCNNTSTPNPTNTCSYSNTQARVQQTVNDPWQKDIHIACNNTFRVGSFHNGTGSFSGDTTFRITDPMGFVIDKATNGSTLKAFFGGTYHVAVRTTNQSGPQCEEEATITADCSSANVPEIWVSMLRQYLLGSI